MQDKIEIIIQKLKSLQIFKGIPKQRKIIGIIIVLLLGFLLYQSLLAKQLLRLQAIGFQFSSQKKLQNFYTQLMKHSGTLIDETKETKMSLARTKEKFISEEELPDYFDNFRSLVRSHNIEIISLDFKPQESIGGVKGKSLDYFKRLPLVISLKGSYSNTIFLLYRLERGSPLFDIASINIKQEDPDSYEVLVDMQAAIYILIRKEKG